MAYKTKLEVVTKIERDLDLEAEDFIQPDELAEYINDAITIIEAHINTMGLRDQYFLKRTTMSLVNGQADYSLPSDLYANKIKEIVYSNGATIYRVEPMTMDSASEMIEHLNRFATTEYYHYRIRNESSTSIVLQLCPASRETASNVIVIEYYRDLERVGLSTDTGSDSDLVEIPEIAMQFLYQFIRTKVYEKEAHANYPQSLVDLAKLEKMMLDILQGQLADDKNNMLELDKSIYEEIS